MAQTFFLPRIPLLEANCTIIEAKPQPPGTQ